MKMLRGLPWAIALISACWLLPALSLCQPSVNNVQTASTGGGYTTLTVNNLVVSGSDRCVEVCVLESGGNGIGVSTVAFNTSESLTQAVSTAHGNKSLSFWHLTAPTATTADVVITVSSAETNGTILATAFALSDCAQALPSNTNTAGCSDCISIGADLTTTANNTLILTCAEHNAESATWVHGGGQTERSDFGQGTGPGESMSTSSEVKAVAGLESLSSTASFQGTFLRYLVMGIPLPIAAPSSERRRIGVIQPR